jgi:predicted alpha-1,2-mannosidase
MYDVNGWLAKGPAGMEYIPVMVAEHEIPLMVSAYQMGIRDFDKEKAFQAMKKMQTTPAGAVAGGFAGNRDLVPYMKYKYVPADLGRFSNSLEYSYDDFTIYQLGRALGKPASEIDIYKKRAMNYKNLFDPASGLMRGKNQDGTFQSPFSPFKWGGAFTEGNSWHYTWSVFQDVDGLAKLMGGHSKFVTKLDSVFSMPPVFDESAYGGVIHEIREMQIANMGQYAHGNQPIQHMIYLYNYGGAPYKTQYWVRETMNRMYKATPDGYCGDEDNGQTSAWYVFSAMGFYPVTPAVDQYVLGAPLFKKVTITLENGKTVVINAAANSDNNRYVQSLQMNGKPYSKNWISHSGMQKGAVLNFNMTATPNKTRGSNPADFPYSLSTEK